MTLGILRFGLLDTENNTWLGTDQGPLVYEDMQIARVARQIIAAQIPCSPLRISIEPFRRSEGRVVGGDGRRLTGGEVAAGDRGN